MEYLTRKVVVKDAILRFTGKRIESQAGPGNSECPTKRKSAIDIVQDRSEALLSVDYLTDHAGLLVSDDLSTFMNRVALATGWEKPGSGPKPAKKAKSHIHQARSNAPKVDVPKTGPMADMLKKLFGKE